MKEFSDNKDRKKDQSFRIDPINKKNSNLDKEKYDLEILSKAFDYHSKGDIKKAEELYQSIIEIGIKDPNLYSNYGVICKQNGKIGKAISLYKKSILNFPQSPQAYANLGSILQNIGDFREAELMTRNAIKLDPLNANNYINLGSILESIGEHKQAKKYTEYAIKIDKKSSLAYSNLGRILISLGDINEAKINIYKAIDLNPMQALAHMNLGLLYMIEGKLNKDGIGFKEAINSFEIAIGLDNNLSTAKSELLRSASYICDWESIRKYSFWLKDLGIKGSSICPLTIMPFEDDPVKHLNRAEKFYKSNYRVRKNFNEKPIKRNSINKSKIRIGYFSARFLEHPSMILLSRVFELHDKNKFEIYAYSLRNIEEDIYTSRIKRSVYKFINLGDLSDAAASEQVRKDMIDIAIDLTGYSADCRMRIFSYRVAPIQISFLEFLGSTGSDCIDYLLADKQIIPSNSHKFYSERIINLPNCVHCNDDTIKKSDKEFSREELGLPKHGFIFCNFGNTYKIMPKEFDIWMKLLHEVKDSVLWLYQSNDLAKVNLLAQAEKRGVSSSRIIFAPRVPLDMHMSRQECADLFLDTFNQNSGAMTFLALKCNLPVLTLAGKSMIARISSSILNSMGLKELITTNVEDYKKVAYELATNKKKYKSIKCDLKELQLISPYFDSELFTRNLEKEFINLFA